jgi:hypothetical protein
LGGRAVTVSWSGGLSAVAEFDEAMDAPATPLSVASPSAATNPSTTKGVFPFTSARGGRSTNLAGA